MNINVHYYSERGLIHCLINWLKEKESNIHKLISIVHIASENEKSKTININKIDEISVYNEFSFGEFGNPDLIIRIKSGNNSIVLVMEAKLTSFKKARTLGVGNADDKEIKYKGHASDIDVQLILRKRFFEAFIDALKTNQGYIKQKEQGYKTKGERSLQKQPLLYWLSDNFSTEDIVYYVAITNDDEDCVNSIYNTYIDKNNRRYPTLTDYNPVIDRDKFGLIIWKELVQKINNEQIRNTCKYTFGEQDDENPFKK